MTDKQLLEQVLSCLENWKHVYSDCWDDFDESVITAIRARLKQPEQQPVAWMVDVDLANYQGQSEYRTILAWNAKPVWSGTHEINEVLKAVPLYTTPPAAPVQEPHSWYSPDLGDYTRTKPEMGEGVTWIALFTASTPPAAQRQWVGLTPQEVHAIWSAVNPDWHTPRGAVSAIYEHIDAKLKEKNT